MKKWGMIKREEERERQRGSFFMVEPNLACHPVGTILSKAQRR